jgi:hypothetical protein
LTVPEAAGPRPRWRTRWTKRDATFLA